MNTEELKKRAEAAKEAEGEKFSQKTWTDYYEAANPSAILKLLAINAELVEALKLISIQDQGCGGNVTGEEAWRASQHIALATLAKVKGGEL